MKAGLVSEDQSELVQLQLALDSFSLDVSCSQPYDECGDSKESEEATALRSSPPTQQKKRPRQIYSTLIAREDDENQDLITLEQGDCKSNSNSYTSRNKYDTANAEGERSWFRRISSINADKNHKNTGIDRDLEMSSVAQQQQRQWAEEDAESSRTRRYRVYWVMLSCVVVISVILAASFGGNGSETEVSDHQDPTTLSSEEYESHPPILTTDEDLKNLEIACEWIGVPNDASSCQMVDQVYSVTHGSSIPTQIAMLTNLTSFFLWENRLTGTIPSELEGLTNLQHLDLISNGLTGTVPPSLGSLTKLTRLLIAHNKLTGTIPSELGLVTNLTELILSGTSLTGTIPSSLGKLTELDGLDLSGNRLNGTIPAPVLQKGITRLRLHDNELSGTIPSTLENLVELHELNVAGNSLLAGAISSTLCSDVAPRVECRKIKCTCCRSANGTSC